MVICWPHRVYEAVRHHTVRGFTSWFSSYRWIFAAGILDIGLLVGNISLLEPLLFMVLDHLMKVFGWRSFIFPSMDDCACWFDGLVTCALLCWSPLDCVFDGYGPYYLVMMWFLIYILILDVLHLVLVGWL